MTITNTNFGCYGLGNGSKDTIPFVETLFMVTMTSGIAQASFTSQKTKILQHAFIRFGSKLNVTGIIRLKQ